MRPLDAGLVSTPLRPAPSTALLGISLLEPLLVRIECFGQLVRSRVPPPALKDLTQSFR